MKLVYSTLGALAVAVLVLGALLLSARSDLDDVKSGRDEDQSELSSFSEQVDTLSSRVYDMCILDGGIPAVCE